MAEAVDPTNEAHAGFDVVWDAKVKAEAIQDVALEKDCSKKLYNWRNNAHKEGQKAWKTWVQQRTKVWKIGELMSGICETQGWGPFKLTQASKTRIDHLTMVWVCFKSRMQRVNAWFEKAVTKEKQLWDGTLPKPFCDAIEALASAGEIWAVTSELQKVLDMEGISSGKLLGDSPDVLTVAEWNLQQELI
ncbi:hypothetical protein PHLCEN_2v7071 [Hermanssonia centrifuga]|uniref:Uncharacterized protein n=1 Tax=Hermanssonia centrifuga TaxID=98765 RepID=A0A2R6NY84_9APHY|nr:hypothetical protein PHLCEN_2v7071 [Hermanssonia centrifuga]